MKTKIQVCVLVITLLSLCISSIESLGFNLVMQYVRCTEPNIGVIPSDATFRRRLAAYDTVDKAMSFYREIYTQYNTTSNSALRQCMLGIYYDGFMFLKEDFFNTYTRVVKEVKAPYKLLPLDKIDTMILLYLQLYKETHPYYVDYILKYEYSFSTFFHYKETTPCGEYLFNDDFRGMINPNNMRLLRSSDCPDINFNVASPQEIENAVKCELKQMNKHCVKPALRYLAVILATSYPQIIKGDLYSYASSLTNGLSGLNSSPRSSIGTIYWIMSFVTLLFSFINIF